MTKRLPLGLAVFLFAVSCKNADRAPLEFAVDSDATSPTPDATDDALADALPDVADDAGDAITTDANVVDAPADAPADDTQVADSGSDAAPITTLCDPKATYGNVTQLGVSTSDDDRLTAVTPDELTIAWVALSATGTSTYYWADRANVSAPFAQAHALTAPSMGIRGRTALSPDGLRLVFVSGDGQSLQQLVRGTRNQPFAGTPDATPFANINALVAATADATVADPVIGADDLSLWFSLLDPVSTATVRKATRSTTSEAWPTGTAMTRGDFEPSTSGYVHPTGVSADGMTVFVWDDSKQKALAIYMVPATPSFTGVVDLGTRQYVAPSASCATLYYSGKPVTKGAPRHLFSEQ